MADLLRVRRRRRIAKALVGIAIAVLPLAGLGCDRLLTVPPDADDRFDQPFGDLGAGELGRFLEGRTQFRRGFAINEGLGPIFNNRSCASCHSGDGRGFPENRLTRFSRGTDLIPAEGGPQIQDKAIPGAEPEVLPPGVDLSLRLPPPVFGMGLIEAIPESAILAHEDAGDADADGISGRANWVTPASYVPAGEPGGGAGPRVGRFGRKAQVPALLQQAVEAYHQDMGITSSFQPAEIENAAATRAGVNPDRVSDPEIGGGIVGSVLNYLRMLAPPGPGEWNDSRRRGETVFQSIRCASCHVPTLRTTAGADSLPQLTDQDVTLYSDLLLHDLGDGLADHRPDGSADGREWRTAPLWGLRIVREFLQGRVLLLHDGRARSVEEAILLHGGEAQAARDAFAGLSPEDRAALVDFVESR